MTLQPGILGAFENDFMDFNYLLMDVFTNYPGTFYEWAAGGMQGLELGSG